MKIFWIFIVSLFAALSSVICDGTVYAREKEDGDRGSVRYTTHIMPIFEKRCAMCHGADSPEHKEFSENRQKYASMFRGPRMDSYTCMTSFVVWPDTGAIMRRLDDGRSTRDGKPGNMYQYLGDTEEERKKNLSIFKEWIDYWTLKRWSGITKKELDKIKVEY